MKKAVQCLLIGWCSALILGTSCKKDDPVKDDPEEPTTEVLPISENNKVIYEVNLRNYSAQGNMAGLTKDLTRLKELGVDILWMMPIHPIGEKNKNGSKGSPYAVKDYKAIHPDFGTAADLKSLVSAAHAAGMEIWLDWVANHTAWDHVWVNEHPDYYATRNGQRPYSPMDWADVIQLDFKNNAMRTAMIDAMKYWVREFDIDGYRCDYATGVPIDFWQKAMAEVNTVKPIHWLCEGDVASYMSVFEADYAWSFNTALNHFGKSNDVAQLKTDCKVLFNNSSYTSKMRMVYLTNHDLSAYDGTEFARYGSNVLPLTVLYFTIYDMPLIYNGQEVGMTSGMGLFDINKVQWSPVNASMNNLMKKLTKLKRSQPALESGKNRGSLTFYATNNDNILAYSRKRGNNEVLVLLNFSKAPAVCQFKDTPPSGEFTNYLNSGNQTISTQTSLTIPANGYAVYVKK